MRVVLSCGTRAGTELWASPWLLEDPVAAARPMATMIAATRRRHAGPLVVALELDLPDRVTTWTWDASDATASNLAGALREPGARLDQREGAFIIRRHVVGPWRVFTSKEVGPPPWRWPHIGLWLHRDRVAALVGWRSTACHAAIQGPTVGPAAGGLLAAAAVGAAAYSRRRRSCATSPATPNQLSALAGQVGGRLAQQFKAVVIAALPD